jgi:arabinogalactan endo-1,4-beta-galactosidase
MGVFAAAMGMLVMLTSPSVRGADMSFLPQIEANSGLYRTGSTTVDPLDLMRQRGCNLVRIRIWNDPKDGNSGVPQCLALAKRVKAAKLQLLLDFHYSDTWADPGHQIKPEAWKNLSFSELKSAVRTFTRDTVNLFIRQKTIPDMVQVGNEVRSGILWPDGASSNFDQFSELMKAGLEGVKQAGPLKAPIKTMVHTDSGGDVSSTQWLYDGLGARGVRFDVIGLSYYPQWHGTLDALSANLTNTANRYGKPVMVVETAYPWTFETGPFTGDPRVWGTATAVLPGYPATPQGQAAFLTEVSRRVNATPRGLGAGVVYWEPDWIGTKTYRSSGDNLTLFDFYGDELPGLAALGAG